MTTLSALSLNVSSSQEPVKAEVPPFALPPLLPPVADVTAAETSCSSFPSPTEEARDSQGDGSATFALQSERVRQVEESKQAPQLDLPFG